VLLDYMNFFAGGYEAQLRDALHAKAVERDLDLLLIYGRALETAQPVRGSHNAIFNHVDPARVAGVIVISATLSSERGAGVVSQFVERFRGVPLCSIGLAVPGVPSLVIDNHTGMVAIVEHLLREHGCRRLAFISGAPGHPEGDARFQAYLDVLERHDIPFDPALIAPGNFSAAGGRGAIQQILARGAKPDGIVAANDSMALGAITALRSLGYHLPRELPVTGFDDLAVARLGNPPLTTVAQPFDLMADAALDMVQAQVVGRPVKLCSELVTEVMIRRSCGCDSHARFARGSSKFPSLSPLEQLRVHSRRIHLDLGATLKIGFADRSRDAQRLFSALEAELDGQPHSFLPVLEDLLEDASDDNERYRALQNALTLLREELRDSAPGLDGLWCDAFGMLALANTTAQMQHRLRLDQSYLKWLTASEQVSAAFDLASLRSALLRSLPATGIRTAFLSRYVDDGERVEPFVALLEGAPQPTDGGTFEAADFLPPGAYPEGRRHTSLIFPLVFEGQPLGVAAFEYTPGTSGYHVMRDQVCVALRTAGLHNEVVQKTMLHERSVQERLATAKRMKALSLLAGGVAHDLNNALGPLVALPDAIVHELELLPVPPGSVAELRTDIETIQSAALRASHTIKDLLTLGRQGRTAREALDLLHVVEQSLPKDSLAVGGDPRRVKITVEPCAEPLVVQGSEAHLVRAVSNLVRNAKEAVADGGVIVIKTFRVHLPEAVTYYETIEAGDYAVVAVSDNGSGIAVQDLGRVFEPYYSRKPLGEHSGSGLGLAIVHGVVKEHGGFIDVTSAIGAGTTFALYFPSSDAPLGARRPTFISSQRNARILVVDDDPIQLRTARRVLAHLGYQVETVSGSRDALDSLRNGANERSPYDLLILDMLLNESKDGLDLFEQVQRVFPEQRAIIVSGHAPNERAEQAMSKGLTWLGKPYTTEALARTIEATLADAQECGAGVAVKFELPLTS
jgi:DNA-binding LacI/PurR family transcriptional regulator/signal transduction histidine kinase/ActR/RegA family two-component response regulator